MLNSVKALLSVVFLLALISVPLMCETDARRTARSVELIRKHALTAAENKDAIATNKKEYTDAWNRTIIYEFGPDVIVGTSSGFDGKIGTDDDIVVVINTSKLKKMPLKLPQAEK
ncbi:hypothetical protein [Gimesia maris]|uniref:hypothetical protein n=1 Tax=Gimesia maris TaxID=122 RepID=UPI00241E6B2B|nr:hypothetical protein [Gimesia maris]